MKEGELWEREEEHETLTVIFKMLRYLSQRGKTGDKSDQYCSRCGSKGDRTAGKGDQWTPCC